jgi:hypothetical protein
MAIDGLQLLSGGFGPMIGWRLASTLIASVLLLVVGSLPAEARGGGDHDPIYLALGDSVAFGFNPLSKPKTPTSFVGYPEVLAKLRDLDLTNAACPGETSSGFISMTGIDNGCRPFHANFLLHASYPPTTTQLDFAIAFLRTHPQTRLVTLDIGANDVFVLQKTCANDATCIRQGLPALLATLSQNLHTIYSSIRNEAHYTHRLVGVTYYALNYRDATNVAIVQAVNNVIVGQTLAAGGRVADGFGAFGLVARIAGGDACAAGLLIVTSAQPRTCDVHPSRLGQTVLATSIGIVAPDVN